MTKGEEEFPRIVKIRPRYVRTYSARNCTTIAQFLFVLLACTAHVFVSSSLLGNETDRLSLLEFKDAISLDPHQVFLSWNESNHFCNWEGIMCREKKTLPRRVTSLNLTSRGLVGQISPSLGNLSFLQSLVLTQNTLSGEIPPSLGHLGRLQTLYLNNNSLQGMIPSFANSSKLTILHVSSNNLVGQFPADLPPRLHILQVSMNNLTSTIPASLTNITTLTTISFTYNYINGNIPSEFAQLSNLQYLQAGANKMEGMFPQAIMNLSTLSRLSLAFNGLSGELPGNIFTSLPNLQTLAIGGNFFVGNIPSSFTNATSLNKIDLSHNNLSGYIPNLIGKLTKLTWLNLDNNQLQAHTREDWEFLDSLGNCTELQLFSMGSNLLSGHLPSSLGNISNQLQHLYMVNNQISGNFPSGIANLHNLIIVSLSKNLFTGVLPEWIGTLKKLQRIYVDKNFFTGNIPSSLSNLSKLGVLQLHSNQFTGHIPPSFGNFPMLQYLDISNNSLYGRVPMEIFKIPSIIGIFLSLNYLSWKLPTNIGIAKQLVSLALSSNKLSGDIPNTLGDCQSLEAIWLDSNEISGNIPASLGRITSLTFLNFSTNNLTGSIPIALGNLQHIEKLDLSFNHLTGVVPVEGIFKNSSALWISGNQGLCGGVLELNMPSCSVISSKSARHEEYLFLKVVIPIASMVSLAMVVFGLFKWRDNHKRKSISLPSFSTNFPKVSFNDLARATRGFSTSNLIGRGGYSSVYQGKLVEYKNEVAVKVFNLETIGAQRSFITECNALRNVRHRNLVSILTVCSSIDSNGNDFKALVYDFMPQGDLHKLLYSTQDNEGYTYLNMITIAQRMSIVVDVADAMEYLHHNNHQTMVHFDLKPSNILLDENMTAHVGDFGLARFRVGSTTSSLSDTNSSSVGLRGTIGYIAPEFPGGGQLSTSADVYSFGVVLLEIFLRRRPTDDIFKDGLSIVKFTKINFPDKVMEIVDSQLIQELELLQETPMVLKEKGVHALLAMIDIGLCCTKTSPSERINMQEVATKLHGIMDAYLRGN